MAGIDKLVEKFTVQDAVYWGNPRDDGFGKKTYDPPTVIKVRWEDKSEVRKTADGKEVMSIAEVLVRAVLDEEGMLALGNMEELPLDIHPSSVPGAYEILARDRIPMPRSTTQFVNIVYLTDRGR